MEHYKELIELRKKYPKKDASEMEVMPANYPATNILNLFGKDLTERDQYWLLYENETFINRGQSLLPHSVIYGLKNHIFLIKKDETIYSLLKSLYSLKPYNPVTYLIPALDLPENTRKLVTKNFEELQKIEGSLNIFAVGAFQSNFFTFCVYNKINKNIAQVFWENGCSILCSNVNNSYCLYFDPMQFSNKDLDIVASRLRDRYHKKINNDFNYDNYSLSFTGNNISNIDLFNLINENPEFAIGNNKSVQVKPKGKFSNKFKK